MIGSSTVPGDEPVSALASWGRNLLRFWWLPPTIGASLVLAFGDVGSSNWDRVGSMFMAATIASLCIHAAISGLYAFVVDTWLERRTSPLARGLTHFCTVFVGVGIGSELALALSGLVLGPSGQGSSARWELWQTGLPIGAAVTAVWVVTSQLQQTAREAELARAAAERETLEAELTALRARLDPHFLFNALNTVADLIEHDSAQAVRAVEELSRLLRAALEDSRHKTVSLEHELALVQDYLGLERLRFENRLRVTLEIGVDAAQIRIPPLLIQPLVENAVKHAVASSPTGATIVVRAREQGQHLVLTVEDDGPGSADSEGTQTGEQSVRRRLALTYGEQALIEAGPRPGGGWRVLLELPLTS